MSHKKAMLQITIVNVATGYDEERGGGVKFLKKMGMWFGHAP